MLLPDVYDDFRVNHLRSVAVCSILLVATLVASDEIRMPDDSTGVIGGRTAILFWPSKYADVDDRCKVVLAPWSDFAAERAFACGVWFQPPEDRYQSWIEMGDDRISPVAATINFAPTPFQGRGQRVIMPVGAGGRVALAPDVALPDGAEVSLMNFDSCCRVVLGVPFTRRLKDRATLQTGVMMPTGTVFAGVFERRTRDAIAIARPVRVEEGKAITIAPRPPAAGTSDVFVSLGRSRIRKSREDDIVQLTLNGKKPEMLFDGDDRIYAAWFSVQGSSAQFAVESKTLQLPERAVKLTAGKVSTVREELRVLPSIRVSLLAPSAAFGEETPIVDVLPPSSSGALRSLPIHPGEEAILDALPLESLAVVLRVGPWRFRKLVDLTAGADDHVVFDLHPIVVTGEVFYGRERARNAEVAFEADDGFVKTTTTDEGRYRITLWHGGDAWAALVTIPGRPGPPLMDGFLQINESRTLDFRVPRTAYDVRVVDAVSGKGIAGARVVATNVFLRDAQEATVMQDATAATDGVARLAPLREGRLEIRATAEGYFDSAKVDAKVDGIESEAAFEVRLQPLGETVAVRLRTADGRAAALADVRAVRAPHGIEAPLWYGKSDETGTVRIPRNIEGATLLIRSPDAASAVRTFDADAAADIILQPAAPTIRVDAPSRTRIALWIDGVRVSGPAVSFLTWSAEASDAEGTWSAKNLPAQPLRLIAWQRTPVQDIAAGLRDANATIIPYPWPSSIALEPFD